MCREDEPLDEWDRSAERACKAFFAAATVVVLGLAALAVRGVLRWIA